MTHTAEAAPSAPQPAVATAPQKPWQRLLDFGRPPRIVGLDIARGLAIIGMIAAHIAGIDSDFEWGVPSTWGAIVHGNPSILFALLAGISIALMTGRTRRPEPEDMPTVRLRMVARAAVIFIIGVLLEQLGTNIAIILTFYGVLYVVALPFLRARRRTLILWAAGLALFGPTLQAVAQTLSANAFGPGLELVFNGTYSLPVWASLMLAGLAIGRSQINRARVAACVLGIGVLLAAIGFGAGALYSVAASWGWDGEPDDGWSSVEPHEPDMQFVPGESVDLTGFECEVYEDEWVSCWPVVSDAASMDDSVSWSNDDAYFDDAEDYSYSGWEDYPGIAVQLLDPSLYTHALLASSPHSGGTAEILGSGGLAMAIVGLLLLSGRWLRWPLLPVAALGAMPLTAYTAHVVWIFVLVGPGGSLQSAVTFGLITASLAILCSVWLALFGRGPLERLTRWVGIRLTR